MAKPILDEALWERIQPLLPPAKRRRRRYPGRKPIPHRAALTGILFVLRSGILWESLPQEMGCGSGMTCWRRLHDWQEAGVWERIRRALLNELRAATSMLTGFPDSVPSGSLGASPGTAAPAWPPA